MSKEQEWNERIRKIALPTISERAKRFAVGDITEKELKDSTFITNTLRALIDSYSTREVIQLWEGLGCPYLPEDAVSDVCGGDPSDERSRCASWNGDISILMRRASLEFIISPVDRVVLETLLEVIGDKD